MPFPIRTAPGVRLEQRKLSRVLLLLAEVQQQDGCQSHELVGHVAGHGVVGPPIRHGRCRVGQAVDAGDDLGVVGAHGGRGPGAAIACSTAG